MHIRTRILLFAVAGGSLTLSLFPQILRALLDPYLVMSQTPEQTGRAALLFLRLSAIFLALFALVWPRIVASAVWALERLAELSNRSYWVLTLGLAALLRVFIGVALSLEAYSDAAWYEEAAESLSEGEGLRIGGELTAYRFPGYPFLLSLIYRVVGVTSAGAWIWGVAATLGLILVTHHLALTLHGSRRAARVAGLALALYPATALTTGFAMSDLPFAAGLVLLVSIVVQDGSDRPSRAAVIGILLAGLTLIRGSALGLGLIVLILWNLRGAKLRRALVGFAILSLTMVAGLLPWILRNQAVFGRAVLSTNVGLNLYIGNYEGASGGYGSSTRIYPVMLQSLNEADADRELFETTVTYIAEHPSEIAGLLPKKLFHLYALETTAVSQAFRWNEHLPRSMKYASYAVSQLAYMIVLFCFLRRTVELVATRFRPRGVQWASWLLIGYFTLVTLVFFGQDRYRLPILPLMVIEASVVIARVRRSGAGAFRLHDEAPRA